MTNCIKPVLPAVPSSEVYLEDCVKALKRFNDKHFDLDDVESVDVQVQGNQIVVTMSKPVDSAEWKGCCC